MKIKKEQILALIGENPSIWASKQFNPTDSFKNKKYSDFFNITEEDVRLFIRENKGIPITHPYCGIAYSNRDNSQCILEENGEWKVVWSERGRLYDITHHKTKEEAEMEVMRRIIKSTKIELNHRYWHAHRELHLPDPDEMT